MKLIICLLILFSIFHICFAGIFYGKAGQYKGKRQPKKKIFPSLPRNESHAYCEHGSTSSDWNFNHIYCRPEPKFLFRERKPLFSAKSQANLYLRELNKHSSPVGSDEIYSLNHHQGIYSSPYKSRIVREQHIYENVPYLQTFGKTRRNLSGPSLATVLPRPPHRIPYDHNSPPILRQRTIPRTNPHYRHRPKGPQ